MFVCESAAVTLHNESFPAPPVAHLQAGYAPPIPQAWKGGQRKRPEREAKKKKKMGTHSVGWYFSMGCPVRLQGGN